MSELEDHPGQRAVLDPPVKSETFAALKTHVVDVKSQLKTNKEEVRDRAKAVGMVARISGRMTAVRGELLTCSGLLEEGAIRGHHNVRDSSKGAVG